MNKVLRYILRVCTFCSLGVLAFQLQSCVNGDNERKVLEVSALDPGFMAYCYFKEGTYWVYKEQNTGELDSQWVENDSITNTKSYTRENGDYDNVEYILFKGFRYKLFSSRKPFFYDFGGGSRCTTLPKGFDEHTCFLMQYRKSDQDYEVLSSPFFIYNLQNNYDIYFNSNPNRFSSRVVNIHDSLTVASQTFLKTVEVILQNDPNDLTSKTKRLAIAKNFGIVQISYKTDNLETYPGGWEVWDLIRYSIVQ